MLAERARAAGIPMAIDPEPAALAHGTEALAPALHGAEVVFLNERVTASIGDVHAFSARHRLKSVVRTRGLHGAVLTNGSGEITVAPSPTDRIIDTTAAGNEGVEDREGPVGIDAGAEVHCSKDDLGVGVIHAAHARIWSALQVNRAVVTDGSGSDLLDIVCSSMACSAVFTASAGALAARPCCSAPREALHAFCPSGVDVSSSALRFLTARPRRHPIR